jgi:hypothetical protein
MDPEISGLLHFSEDSTTAIPMFRAPCRPISLADEQSSQHKLYLCKTWQDEGKKLEEEAIQTKSEVPSATENLEWLREFRLNLKPELMDR